MIKPISVDELDAHLLGHHQADEAEQSSTEQLVVAPDSVQLVDLGPLEHLISSEPMKIRQILDELIRSNHEDSQLMSALLLEGEIDKLAELAHRIKGAARVVEGEHLVQCCRRLEAACLDPHVSLDRLKESVTQVKAGIGTLEQALLGLRQ